MLNAKYSKKCKVCNKKCKMFNTNGLNVMFKKTGLNVNVQQEWLTSVPKIAHGDQVLKVNG